MQVNLNLDPDQYLTLALTITLNPDPNTGQIVFFTRSFWHGGSSYARSPVSSPLSARPTSCLHH